MSVLWPGYQVNSDSRMTLSVYHLVLFYTLRRVGQGRVQDKPFVGRGKGEVQDKPSVGRSRRVQARPVVGRGVRTDQDKPFVARVGGVQEQD